MTDDSAHQSGWEIAEIVFGVPFLIGLGLHFLVPWSLPAGILRQTLVPAGILLFIVGIAWIVLARRELARYAQPTDPGHPTSKLVQTSVFAISRNPLYLGCVLGLLGLALALNMLWALAALLVSIVLCLNILILPEERYLAARFGQEYAAYRKAVQRWLGRS